jgi:sugar O-acyltransferase (sialic acid O-acetyltransferase NeuD family)
LIGAGGHAKVVLEAMQAAGHASDSIIVRDGSVGRSLMGHPVNHPELLQDMAGMGVHVAIGNNVVRVRLLTQALANGATLLSVVHPNALISPSAEVAGGTFVAARVVIGAESKIGRGAILNHGCIVDHDCFVGAGTHIAPAAVLGGEVRVGANVLVGANATILPGLEIGDGAVIGAGAVVTKSVRPNEIWVGSARSPREAL